MKPDFTIRLRTELRLFNPARVNQAKQLISEVLESGGTPLERALVEKLQARLPKEAA